MTPTTLADPAAGLLPVWPAVVVFAVLIAAALALFLTLYAGGRR